jgi:threonine dehydrogenase-like Zn-dependent dehydrogenase
MAGAAYGFAGMGPYHGGQAEMLRVPYADFNCLVLPENARDRDRQRDYVMLADIFPTGWHATQLACVQPGDSVVIYGAGPVGQMAALSATIKNAAKIMVVDHHQDRLELAGQCNVKAYNRALLNLIMQDKARPSYIVSHELPLRWAPEGYEHFADRERGWTKVIMHPDL